jgi:uroporphyrinogen-III synthase
MEPIMGAPLGGGPWGGLLVTSANAIRALVGTPSLPALLDLPLLAVGQSTAEIAQQCGFANVRSADGNANALADLAADSFAKVATPLLYLAAEDRAVDLAGQLAARGLVVQTAVIYRMVEALAFPDQIATALAAGQIDGVLHYSARSAKIYLACADAAGLRAAALTPVQACLSEEIGARLRAAGAATVRIAARPQETALLAVFTSPAKERLNPSRHSPGS